MAAGGSPTVTLGELNALDRAAFVAALGGVFEHSPWVADRAYAARPFASVGALHAAMVAAMHAATEAERLALIRAHPELAGKAAVRGELTADSAREQSDAGLAHCSPEEFARLQALNARYNAKFGFPFILAVKGRDRAGIIAEFARRVERSRADEFAECLAQIARIARYRLDDLLAA
jgi:2-oxo-4-hydroxy-4-carboxy-5-ureidoimidazoline decarboxylase